jgi:hypothetical protein
MCTILFLSAHRKARLAVMLNPGLDLMEEDTNIF